MTCRMLFFDFRDSEKKFFEQHEFCNYDIKFFSESLNEETVFKLSEEDFEKTMIISVFISSTIDDNIISKFRNLRVITTRSTGYDHIDINSCVSKNIALINVDAYGKTSVAQFVFALILMLVRNIYSAITAEGKDLFKSNNFTGRNLNTLTIGVVGTGEIGGSVCKLANCFGMRVLAFDIRPKTELQSEYNVQYMELAGLLKNSDIVTVHLPYIKENYHIFSDEQFDIMKDGSYFVNVSRGNLVDTNALLKYARENKFKGIALDVVACPDVNNITADNIENDTLFCVENSKSVKELMELPNVIITPHMAYNTQDSIDFILNSTFESLSDYLKGGRKNRVL